MSSLKSRLIWALKWDTLSSAAEEWFDSLFWVLLVIYGCWWWFLSVWTICVGPFRCMDCDYMVEWMMFLVGCLIDGCDEICVFFISNMRLIILIIKILVCTIQNISYILAIFDYYVYSVYLKILCYRRCFLCETYSVIWNGFNKKITLSNFFNIKKCIKNIRPNDNGFRLYSEGSSFQENFMFHFYFIDACRYFYNAEGWKKFTENNNF